MTGGSRMYRRLLSRKSGLRVACRSESSLLITIMSAGRLSAFGKRTAITNPCQGYNGDNHSFFLKHARGKRGSHTSVRGKEHAPVSRQQCLPLLLGSCICELNRSSKFLPGKRHKSHPGARGKRWCEPMSEGHSRLVSEQQIEPIEIAE
jgi:hypothetical protein